MKNLILFLFIVSQTISLVFSQQSQELTPTYFTKYSGQYVDLENNFTSEYTATANTGILFVGMGDFSITTRKHIRKEEREAPDKKYKFNTTTFHWVDYNKSASITPNDPTGSLVIFGADSGLESFKELVVKGLYEGIDVRYELPTEGGLKYSLYLSPKANVSSIKMKLNDASAVLQKDGSLLIQHGDDSFVDHAPIAFYEDTKEPIGVHYVVNSDNTISFELENYDTSRAIVIDPWVVNQANSIVGGIKQDNLGNTYVTVINTGTGVFQLRKYSITNTLLWTYIITVFWVERGMSPSLEVNPNTGTSYFMVSPAGQNISVSTSGASVWAQYGLANFGEGFAFRFNCAYDELLAVGRPNTGSQHGFGTVNATTGLTQSFVDVGVGLPVNNSSNECRGVCADTEGGYVVLRRNSIIGICPDKTIRFETHINPTTQPCFDYNGNYLITDGTPGVPYSGLESSYQNYIYAGVSDFYVTMGDSLYKFDLLTGVLITSVPIPGGIREAGSGIVVDGCNQIFIGGMTGVHQFDANLNYVGLIPTPEAVTDIDFNTVTNELIVGGIGFFGSYASSVCDPIVCSNIVTNALPDTVICEGESVLLTTQIGSSYTWSPNVGISDVSIQSPVFSPLTTTTYYVQVVRPCGIYYDTVLITVEDCGLNAEIDALEDTICVGGCTTLNGQASFGTTPYSYSWEGAPFSAIDTLVVCPLTTNTYQLIVMDAVGELDTVFHTIYVSEFPIVDLGPDIFDCGNMAVLDATSSLPNATYLWNTNSTNAQIQVVNSGEYWVNVMNGACSNSDTINVNLIGFQIDLGMDIDTCVSVVTLSLPINYTNNWSDGTLGSTFEAAVPGTYWVQSIDQNGCIDTDTITLSYVPMVVNLGNDTIICSGTTLVLNAQNVGSTYTWQNGSTNQSFTVSTAGTYWVNVVNGLCSSTDTIVVDFTEPLALFTVSDTVGCSPLYVSFTDQSTTDQGTIVQWNWNFGDNSTSTLQHPTHLYTSSGLYTVSLTATTNLGCSNLKTRDVIVTVYDSPVAAFTYNPNPAIVDQEVFFVDQSVNATSWLWKFGDNSTSTAQNPVHTYSDPIEYTTILIVSNNGCLDTATIYISINEELIYYVPNTFTPDGDEFNQTFQPVFTAGFDTYDFNMLIFDRWGEIIFESNDSTIGWDGTYKNGKIVQDGLYTWKIEFKEIMSDKRHSIIGHVNVLK